MCRALEQPVALDRWKRRRIVERHAGRRDQSNLAPIDRDTRGFPPAIDRELDRMCGQAATSGDPLDLLRGRAPDEVWKLLVERGRPAVVGSGERRVADEEMVGMRRDASAAGKPREQIPRPAGARGEGDDPVRIFSGPGSNRILDRARVSCVADVDILRFEQGQRREPVRQPCKRRGALRRADGNRFARVGEAADPIPIAAARGVGHSRKGGQHVERPLTVEEGGARERCIVVVGLDDENRGVGRKIR